MIHSPYGYGHAFFGGTLIGLASLLAIIASGTIPGISGIFSRFLRNPVADGGWRILFLFGLIAGAGLLFATVDSASTYRPVGSLASVAVAGILVGFGTRLGGGCTSGHGICGIGMGSRNSIVATMVFMAAGIVTVFVAHHLGDARP
jgi:uncharacterized protein